MTKSWGIALACAMQVLLSPGHAPAQTGAFPQIEEMVTICVNVPDEAICKAEVQSLKSDWQRALKRDYQAQRNVAYCLTNGCNGAVIVDKVEGCAWRMVIQGTSVRKEPTERMSYEAACGVLQNSQRREALDRAEAMYKALYRKELPLEKLMRD